MSISRYRWFLKLCFCVLIMSGNISEAKATNYYVAASNGNDGNSGTLSAPFKTLERGVSVLIPGDTLFVRGGTYEGSHNLAKIPNGNSWDQPITIKKYATEKVVITAESFRSALYFSNGSHHIIIDGFVFDAKGGASGIQFFPGNHHIRILNSEIMNSRQQGILATQPANDLEFIRLKIHDNGSHAGQDHGIYIAGSNHLIEGCEIYRNGAMGISIFSTSYTSENIVMRNNKVYNNGTLGTSGDGIGVYTGKNHGIYNNLVWGNNMGIVVWGGVSNAKVLNNTVHANSVYGIWVAVNSQNAHIKNNIASSNGSNGIIITKGSGSPQIFNNLVAATNSSTGLKNWEGNATVKGNVAGSINDIKYANHQNRDFHIQQGSLAIAAGVVLSEVKNDFDYASRNSNAYDIGAFAFNGTPPPASSTPPPSTSTPPPSTSTPPPSTSTPPPSSSPTSSSLSISNLTVASGQAYVVSASGLQTGARAYIDRSYTFTSVPSIVSGARFIQTANNDKAATSSTFLRFTVNEPVLVYVAHGDRISSKPSWLSTFTNTGAKLVTSDATFSLYVRSFPAGTVTLGGNASGGCCSMYSVVVTPQSGTTTSSPPPSSSTSSSSFSISNLTVASGQAYVVPTSGLQAGARVYIDRAYTFKTVPSNVQGGTYIQTANNDKAGTSSTFLRFTVNQAVSVYVAHGDRISSKPSWLSAFTDTGADLVTSDATFSLYVRSFPAGTITLGGNASGGCCSMYSVIVKQ
ncbi:right-handed parallel beta-helix repeat-containing protein [Candidatus Nitrospira neomarina]|uniref:Right-handed parallel beta-helix repeat-containing protein n=1 Tax=Candidatus Nitrospira neomarina TaxID=3020899 RepID=A0AA96GML1_9BACT|nr:right-handed parallel beta-helix repeat-containing protein [Candidatus Nitrospira neomarina]WNM60281.1 right-handed parallel beta-helix repeat-containing protein [Candidatus Nitrospira neomarina]